TLLIGLLCEPYFLSPTIGCIKYCICTRILYLRPVSKFTCCSDRLEFDFKTLLLVTAFFPWLGFLLERTMRALFSVSHEVMVPSSFTVPSTSAIYERSGTASCHAFCNFCWILLLFANIMMPEVSRSSRWTTDLRLFGRRFCM